MREAKRSSGKGLLVACGTSCLHTNHGNQARRRKNETKRKARKTSSTPSNMMKPQPCSVPMREAVRSSGKDLLVPCGTSCLHTITDNQARRRNSETKRQARKTSSTPSNMMRPRSLARATWFYHLTSEKPLKAGLLKTVTRRHDSLRDGIATP